MGIHGLTDQIRYQRAGKVYLGIKYKSNKQCKCISRGNPAKDCMLCKGTGFMFIPKETDYFVLKPEQVPELIEIYGEQPKKLNIMLPRAWELEKIFPQWLKRYGANVLKCIGDGKIAKCVNPDTLAIEEKPCFMNLKAEGKHCEFIMDGSCVARAILNFRVTKLQNSLKVYQVGTGSYNSILNINTALKDIIFFSLTNRIDIADIKLVLEREEQKTQRIDKKSKKAVPGTHWIMTLDIDSNYYKNWGEIKKLSMGISSKRSEVPIAQLPAPEEIEAEEIVDTETVEEIKESTEAEDTVKIQAYKNQVTFLMKKIHDLGGKLSVGEEEIIDVAETEEDYEAVTKLLNLKIKKLGKPERSSPKTTEEPFFPEEKEKEKKKGKKESEKPGDLFEGQEKK